MVSSSASVSLWVGMDVDSGELIENLLLLLLHDAKSHIKKRPWVRRDQESPTMAVRSLHINRCEVSRLPKSHTAPTRAFSAEVHGHA